MGQLSGNTFAQSVLVSPILEEIMEEEPINLKEVKNLFGVISISREELLNF